MRYPQSVIDSLDARQDWKRHKPMCQRLQDTSLSTVSIPTSPPPPDRDINTFQAIAFPAYEDKPRMITIEWVWVEGDDYPIPIQFPHMQHLFHEDAYIGVKPIHRSRAGEAPLPPDRCLVVILNDYFKDDGSPLNRCIFKL